MTAATSHAGAFIISLDFELRWGVRHRTQNGAYDASLLGAREAIPRILDLFDRAGIAATWATVGFLFARSRSERERFTPTQLPAYTDSALSPYHEATGQNESDDPLHYGASLIDAICNTPRQELATHTFSHFFSHENGQDAAAFRADLQAAQAIAAKRGKHLTSIVFPRNQRNPAYDNVLLECGITAYRGNPQSAMWRFGDSEEADRRVKRVTRLLDAYVAIDGYNTQPWRDVVQPTGLCDVRASAFLRPYDPRLAPFEPLRRRRIVAAMRRAAQQRELFHLWWHPHNFGRNTDQNLASLQAVLTAFAECRDRWGMESLTMADAAARARSVAATGSRSVRHVPQQIAEAPATR